MFSAFHSQLHPISKRRKVNRACNHCRDSRVRCDPTTPCSPCVQNNINCSRRGDSLINTGFNVDRQSSSGQLAQDASIEPPIIAPDSPPERMDSMLGFILRINAFCSGVLQLREPSSFSPNEPHPSSMSPFCFDVRQESTATACTVGVK